MSERPTAEGVHIAGIEPVEPALIQVDAELPPADYYSRTECLARIEDRVYRIDVSDPLYGADTIHAGTLEHAIMQTPCFKRTLHVQQHGERRSLGVMLGVHPHTRGEHALGTLTLIKRKLPSGRSLSGAETVAAIVHDSGHPAFSHHGEAAFDSHREQKWHDRRLLMLLRTPNAAGGYADTLALFEIDPDDVAAALQHPLLDRPLPDLCGDRIDYIVRDSLAMSWIRQDEAERLLTEVQIGTADIAHALTAAEWDRTDDYYTQDITDELEYYRDHPEQLWYCQSITAGEVFSSLLNKLNGELYKSPVMFEVKRLTSQLLRRAMDHEYVSVDDVCRATDDSVIEHLMKTYPASDDSDLQEMIGRLAAYGRHRSRPEVESEILRFSHRSIDEFQAVDTNTTKHRWVDPFCHGTVESGGQSRTVIRRLSYFKKHGYSAHGDHGNQLAGIAQRLSIEIPEHTPFSPYGSTPPHPLAR